MRHSTLPSCPPPNRRAQRRRGAALLIVLAFVVLVTGMVVAFFSRSMSERKVSNSSASQVQVELLAQGAADSIVGALKQEIIAGSSNTVIPVASGSSITLYTPTAPANLIPALAGSTGTNGLENLVKTSSGTAAFYSGANYSGTAPLSASTASTTGTSLNGRTISLERWNKPLLLDKLHPDTLSLTPVTEFTAPSWVLVDRSGGNPNTWSPTLKWSTSNANTVVGRYAYAIYDEGGLLDMNVAGYSGTAGAVVSGTFINTPEVAYKGALAFADVGHLPTTTGTTLGQNDVDRIIAWRNTATATSGSSYIDAVRNNSTGFLTVSSTNGLTDRAFINRQALIKFITSGTLTTSPVDAQYILQFMGTFSRALDRPSFRPNPARPFVKTERSEFNSVIPGGGRNDAYGLDDPSKAAKPINPVIEEQRQADGTPKLARRFPLSRLNAFKDAYTGNVSAADKARALKYFGLTWDAANKLWTIDDTKLKNLGDIDVAADGEPNFFEILRAGIHVGSVGQTMGPQTGVPLASPGAGNEDPEALIQLACDASTKIHILQIGANIIDQADADSFPTHIQYKDSKGKTWDIYGTEDLPGFHSLTQVAVRLPWQKGDAMSSGQGYAATGYNRVDPSIFKTVKGTTPINKALVGTDKDSEANYKTVADTLVGDGNWNAVRTKRNPTQIRPDFDGKDPVAAFTTGSDAYPGLEHTMNPFHGPWLTVWLEQPCIWNPHRPTDPSPSTPALRPTQFRITGTTGINGVGTLPGLLAPYWALGGWVPNAYNNSENRDYCFGIKKNQLRRNKHGSTNTGYLRWHCLVDLF